MNHSSMGNIDYLINDEEHGQSSISSFVIIKLTIIGVVIFWYLIFILVIAINKLLDTFYLTIYFSWNKLSLGNKVTKLSCTNFIKGTKNKGAT